MNQSNNVEVTSAEKLDVTIPQNLYESLVTLATRHDRSISGEIKQAWMQWTDQLSSLKLILALLTSQNGNAAESTDTHISLRTAPSNIKHHLCKFKTGQVHQIKEQANILMVSMNTVILKALVWWVNTWKRVDLLNSGVMSLPEIHLDS
ncbi:MULTISPECIES: hypothetical protein [Pseudomonas]|uniref:hypothetical protein n=1 Tax=Pseudomonas TaxID=286 RepID=UPI0021C16E24|nr:MULTISPECIES: hypothetical protein [Pseudomonas]UXL40672.1 hypothetical protein N7D90_11190 [Pseudomonas fragi]